VSARQDGRAPLTVFELGLPLFGPLGVFPFVLEPVGLPFVFELGLPLFGPLGVFPFVFEPVGLPLFPLLVFVPEFGVSPLFPLLFGPLGVFPFVLEPVGLPLFPLLVLVPSVGEFGLFPLVLEPVGLPLFPLLELVPSDGLLLGFPLAFCPVGLPLVDGALGVKFGVAGRPGTSAGLMEESNWGKFCSTSRLTTVATRGQMRGEVAAAVFLAYKQTTEGRTEPEQKENPHPK
jgi:hypothetical protein